MKEIMGTAGPVGRMEEFGRHTAMELHGRVYLSGHYMDDMTFEEACNVARFRFETDPQNYSEIETGRFIWAMVMFIGAMFLLGLAMLIK